MIDQADRAITPDDVAAVYQLFLGREPESPAVVAEKLSLPLGALVAEIGCSTEFRLYVLKPLLAGGDGSGRFEEPPPAGLGSWVAAVFAFTLDDLARASTWGLLLLEVLAALSSAESVVDGGSIDVDPLTVADALRMRRLAAQSHGLVGAIELLDEDVAEGWALDADSPDRPLVVQLVVDGHLAAAVKPDRFRRDLQDAYGGEGRFGFQVALPVAPTHENGSIRSVRVDLVEQSSQRRLASRRLDLDPQAKVDQLAQVANLLEEVKARLIALETQMPPARAAASFSVRTYDAYRRAYVAPHPAELARQRTQSLGWDARPRFILRGGSDGPIGARTRACAQAQTYPHWCWASEEAASLHDDDYIVALRSGDELEPDALYQLAVVIRTQGQPLLLTVDDDEVRRDEFGRTSFFAPRLRGAYDPWLALQKSEPDALVVVQARVARSVGQACANVDASARLGLAVAAGASRVRHVPLILHHRDGAAPPPQPSASDFMEAVAQEVTRTGVRAVVTPHEDVLGASVSGALRVRPRGSQATLASVIIPTRDRLDLIAPCVEGLLATREANATPFELLIVDNGGSDLETSRWLDTLKGREGVRRLPDAREFNWSQFNNRASEQARGDVLIFLNDDTTPVSPNWCDELCLWASWPGAGVAGARLIYGDGTLQHAGILTGVYGEAANEGVGSRGDDPGYLGRHTLVRRANAVTGACMAVSRKCFEELGGFDESLAISYNDVEFCIRAQARGWSVLYAPQAVFYHFESKTRRFDAQLNEAGRLARRAEAARVHAICGERLARDPFYNAHFERWAAPFSRLAAPPGRDGWASPAEAGD